MRTAHSLVLNTGSSSLKYSLFRHETKLARPLLLSHGVVDKISSGQNTMIKHTNEENNVIKHSLGSECTHKHALEHVINLYKASDSDISMIGHRVVHGGALFHESTLITDQVLETIKELIPLAPLHNPNNLLGISIAQQILPPSIPHVAVFDTAFHHSLPAKAYRYGIPQDWYSSDGIRRYGFHGSSYQYVLGRTSQYLDVPADQLNLIIMHLGAGASMACIRHGKCIDTSMGMSPLQGLVMSTRSGDVDPSLFAYLQRRHGLDSVEVERVLNNESGLYGLCGMKDMRDIHQARELGDKNAELALDVLVYSIRRYLGSYYLELDGKIDGIVFTGGIGERDEFVRERVCKDLGNSGILLDSVKNLFKSSQEPFSIHMPSSRIPLLVVPTNEELCIAIETERVVGLSNTSIENEVAPVIVGMDSSSFTTTPSTVSIISPSNNIFLYGIGNTIFEELGLLFTLFHHQKNTKLGYFRLFAESSEFDSHIAMARNVFDLQDDESSMYGVTQEQAIQLLRDEREDELFDILSERLESYSRGKDGVVVCGSNLPFQSLHWNAQAAQQLNLPFHLILCPQQSEMAVASAGQSPEQILETFALVEPELTEMSIHLQGIIVSGAKNPEETANILAKRHLPVSAVLPYSETLSTTSMAEIAKKLNAQIISGESSLDQTDISRVIVCTLQVSDILPVVKNTPGGLYVLHAGRVDMLLSLLAASMSETLPPIAGIVLTSSKHLTKEVKEILGHLTAVHVPVIGVSSHTYEAANGIMEALNSRLIYPQSARKLDVLHQMYSSLPSSTFYSSSKSPSLDVPPRLFQHSIFSKAIASKRKIVLPEGSDERVLKACHILLKRNVCDIVIIGDPRTIIPKAKSMQLELDGVSIVSPKDSDNIDYYAEKLYEIRKAKGMTLEEARNLILNDENWYATMMMNEGIVDGMVSGAVHTTADTIRPALQILKTAPGISLVSSVFFMLLKDRVLVFGDCAVNVDPTAEQLAEIAVSSAFTAKSFGITPRVAMLSYATGSSNSGPLIDKIRKATEIAQNLARSQGIVDVYFEGPIQFDAAVDPEVARTKFKKRKSNVAGIANVLVFPDLNSGNNAYKAVQRTTRCVAMGPVLQGLAKPVNDLSRGCTVDDIVNTVAITAVQSTQ